MRGIAWGSRASICPLPSARAVLAGMWTTTVHAAVCVVACGDCMFALPLVVPAAECWWLGGGEEWAAALTTVGRWSCLGTILAMGGLDLAGSTAPHGPLEDKKSTVVRPWPAL